jgi:hypothetical protein
MVLLVSNGNCLYPCNKNDINGFTLPCCHHNILCVIMIRASEKKTLNLVAKLNFLCKNLKFNHDACDIDNMMKLQMNLG